MTLELRRALDKIDLGPELVGNVFGKPELKKYLVNLGRHPDKDSNFEKGVNQIVKNMRQRGKNPDDDEEFFHACLQAGFNGLLFLEDKKLAGHLIWQNHLVGGNDEWHMFHIYVVPELRGHHYGTKQALIALQLARLCHREFIELSTGGSDWVQRMYHNALCVDPTLLAHYEFVPSSQHNCLRLQRRQSMQLKLAGTG